MIADLICHARGEGGVYAYQQRIAQRALERDGIEWRPDQ